MARGSNHDRDEIRKGPWKAEEDQVLLNHVRRYGPRDWSSIRSKGLLQRTGKSCRLRWVNKLRPNLKNGCKFSQEEERVVIELQAEFGNKWARIATYLPGRTDNDVKNFWSSRQKRLARILQTSAAAGSSSSSAPYSHNSSKSLRSKCSAPVPSTEVAKLISSREEESPTPQPQCRSENVAAGLKMDEMMFPPPTPQEIAPQCGGGMSYLPEGHQDLLLEDHSSNLLFNVFEPIEAVTGTTIGEAGDDQLYNSKDIIDVPFFELSGGFRSGDIDTFFDDFPMEGLDDIAVDSPASPPPPS